MSPTPTRCLAAALTALATVVLLATPALADTHTIRDDDGTRESEIAIRRSGDRAAQTFVLPTGIVASAATATLGLYARSSGCVPGPATQRIFVAYRVLAEVST